MDERVMIQVHNPYSGELLGEVAEATAEEVAAAVARARQAFAGDQSLPIDRHQRLLQARDLLLAQSEAFARMIALETGKPIRECRIEVSRTATTLHFSAEESLRIGGEIHHLGVTAQRLDRRAFVERVPLGVVAAVTPFNFPLNLPAHKIGPALAAGNAVIVKPSPKAPLVTERFIELFHQAGLAPDLLQVLHGGAGVVEALARARLQALSFTGSSLAGQQVAGWAAGKKLLLEMGGNDPIVILEDADLDLAVAAVVAHRFGSAGQRCTACKRLLVARPVYAQVRQRLLAAIEALVVGDPLDERTDIGPLIDVQAAENVRRKLQAALDGGAQLLIGGMGAGAHLPPTLVEGVRPEDELFYEETFAPVLPLMPFDSFEEAVELVNATPYGLQLGLFTNNLARVQEAFRRFEVGAVIVNDGPALRVEPIPFGGVKASGLGREGIRAAIDEYTTLKTLIV